MKILNFLFYSSIVINTIFPSKFLFGLKTFIFASLIIEVFRKIKLPSLAVLLFVLIIGGLISSLAIGVSVNNEYAIQAFSVYFIFFLLLFTHLVTFESLVQRSNVVSVLLKTYKYLTIGAVGYLIFKYSIYSLLLLEMFTIEHIKQLIPGLIINKFFNQAILTRIFSTSDLTIVFLILFRLWLSKKQLIRGNNYIITLLIVSSILSLNRYVWMVLLVGIFIITDNSTKLRIVKWVSFTVLSCLIFLKNYFYLFIEYLNIKFSDNTSLGIKDLQARHIFNDILTRPIVGNGIGWYNTEIIRDYNQPFQYETQILSLMSQFGIVIFIIIFFSIFRTLLPFNQGFKLRVKYVNFSIILLWFLSGFTNPYLTVIGSIPIYILLKGFSYEIV